MASWNWIFFLATEQCFSTSHYFKYKSLLIAVADADSILILCTRTTAPTTYGDFGADISCKPSAYSSGASKPPRHKTRAPRHKNKMPSLPEQHWGKSSLTEISLHVFWTQWKIILHCFGFRVHKIVTSRSSPPVEVWATMMKVTTIGL